MLNSIKAKFLAWNGFILILVLIVFEIITYYSLHNFLFSRIDSRLAEESFELSALVVHVSDSLELIDDHEWNETEHTEFGEWAIYLQVNNADGKILKKSDNLRRLNIAFPVFNKTALSRFEDLTINENIFRVLQYRPENHRDIIITSALLTSDINEYLEYIKNLFFLITPIVIIFSAIGIAIISSRSLKTIGQITQDARSIMESQDLLQKITRLSEDQEVTDLIDTLNALFEKLNHSLQQIKNFSGDASHELRTPLTIMRGHIEVLLSRERTAKEYREALESIYEEVLRMVNIVNNLLQLARMDSGKLDIDMHVVRLDKIIKEFIPIAKDMARRKNINIIEKTEKNIEIIGNIERIKELLTNLVDNAIKYNHDNGEIEITLSKNSNEALLSVNDNGIGIGKDELPRIFERFYRVDKARSRDYGGTGLGLAIVQWIVNEHKGRIEVKSTKNKGSLFKISLPLVQYENN